MQISTLTLEQFRSYPKLTLTLENGNKPTVLLGKNATGKTNILEAICVLSQLRSPRKAEETDLITWDKEYYKITAIVQRDSGEELTLEVISQLSPRKARVCLVNGVRMPTSRYIGTLPLVTFTPDDLSLFTGPPNIRRRMIDDLLKQVSPAYLSALAEYERAVKQRNTLLKQIREGASKQGLDAWDEKIATLGAMITLDRLQLFETLQMTIGKELSALGEQSRSAHFHYACKTARTEEVHIRAELLEMLLHYRERDVIIASTTVGPHRDDWTLQIERRDIASFASRGQQRAAILAILLLQASFLELRTGEKPVLLLDDVFSELDVHHRKAVLNVLADNQVLISAVELDEALNTQAHVLPCPL